ncbi:NAD(P)-binding protein [Rhizodiscina lignyota]|uniref:NAD(P)-binding protein n=1 Tax=Rhizodiscina lignyota TaxID=1504668 RepID=A0A9P4INV2_9PEZI|nr:NAD(P)-binding protein [Rhizodiscina lignyota]
MPADFEHDRLLVTCASGKQASHLLPHVSEKWKNITLAVHSSTSEERLKNQYPTRDVVSGDLMDPAFVKRIMNGVTAVFHLCPGFHPHEDIVGYNMIDAAVEEAKNGSLKHFVYSSVEEYLMESGLKYTILQPTHFMDMFPVPMLVQQSSPIFVANWDPSIPFSFVALRDLGEAGAKVLIEREKHFFAQYPLVSDGPTPYTDVVRHASDAIGKSIKLEQRPFQEAVNFMLDRFFGEDVPVRARDGMERMLLFYNRRGLVGNSNVLEWLLGRKPTSHEQWMRLAVAEAKQ